MQFTVDYAPFLNHVQYCQSAVDRKKINELLEYIELRVDADQLWLSATDNFLYMQAHIDVRDAVAGTILVPAKTLHDVLRELPPGKEVSCTLDGHILRIHCGQARFRLNTLSPDGFPEPPEVRIEQYFEFPSVTLAKVIQMSSLCISSDDTRKFLTGASFVYDSDQQALQVRTSNGFHMGLLSLPMEVESRLTECMVPLRALQDMRRLCEAINEPVRLGLGAHQACLEFSRVQLFTKTIEEHFPSYERLISEALPSMMETDREQLERALRRCLLVSDELHDVRLSFDGQTVEVSACNRNHESACEPLEAELALADDLQTPYSMSLDGMFLRSILQVLPGTHVQLHFRDKYSLVMIVDRDDRRARYIMMPLRDD